MRGGTGGWLGRTAAASDPGFMGQGFGAVFPIVVVGIVANLLMDAFLRLEIMGVGARRGIGLPEGWGLLGGLGFP